MSPLLRIVVGGAYNKAMTEIDRPNRRTVRLPDFNYRDPGAYYVTLCVQDSRWLFGEVIQSSMVLSSFGRLVDEAWNGLRDRWEGVAIDDWHVVMPNHFHGIVVIEDISRRVKPPRLGDIVARFKASSTTAIRKESQTPNLQVWQRSFYEHVVRDELDLQRIRTYIENNPAQWTEDEYYGLR